MSAQVAAQEIDLDLIGFDDDRACDWQRPSQGCNVNQSFDDWDLFQVGGMIFF